MEKKRINVAVLSMKGNFDKSLGKGPQRYAYELYENLSHLGRSNGINVDKIELGFGSSDLHHKISFTLLLPMLNLMKYDIIHFPAPVMFNPTLSKGKIVTTVHELEIVPKGHMFYGKKKPVIEKFIEKQMLSSNYIIAVSKQAKDEIVSLGFKHNHVTVINNGVDEIFLSNYPKRRARRSKFIVGYIGALNPRKNLKFAVLAFRHIRDPNMVFEIWGKKSGEYENLLTLAKGDKRIKFMGFAPEEKLIETYDRFDAFVFPSVYESHSLTILEARSRGLPIILNKNGNLSDENKEYCFMARSPAHMAEIIKNLKKKGFDEDTRKKAIEYSRGFTWERCAQETIEFYKKIA